MSHLGTLELVLILTIAVLVFGVGKLPEVGSALGKGIRDFRRTLQGSPEEDEAGD